MIAQPATIEPGNGAFHLFLGKKYWFSVPFNGILVATICFCTSFFLIHL
jgi:hypothetical protein